MWITLLLTLLTPASLLMSAMRADAQKASQVPKSVAESKPSPTPTFPPAQELLASADRARSGAASGMSWNVTLLDLGGSEPVSTTYKIRSLNNDARAEVTAPPRSVGEVMLFNDRVIWFHKRGLRKPVSISARQKLSGQAANGDIASTNYARDYEGVVTGEEVIDGVPTWVLMLKSKSKDTTYDQIKYWVSKDRQVGVRAEYLSLEGKPMKHAVFENGNKLKIESGDIAFISKVTITDALNPKKSSIMTYSAPRAEKHAQALFNFNRLAE